MRRKAKWISLRSAENSYRERASPSHQPPTPENFDSPTSRRPYKRSFWPDKSNLHRHFHFPSEKNRGEKKGERDNWTGEIEGFIERQWAHLMVSVVPGYCLLEAGSLLFFLFCYFPRKRRRRRRSFFPLNPAGGWNLRSLAHADTCKGWKGGGGGGENGWM